MRQLKLTVLQTMYFKLFMKHFLIGTSRVLLHDKLVTHMTQLKSNIFLICAINTYMYMIYVLQYKILV